MKSRLNEGEVVSKNQVASQICSRRYQDRNGQCDLLIPE